MEDSEAQIRTLQRLLLEKERECELYVGLAAERLDQATSVSAGGGSSDHLLRDALAERLGIPRAGISDVLFDGMVLKEVEALLAARAELQRRNLAKRGHDSPDRAAAARRGAAGASGFGASGDSGDTPASELTTAVGNVNKVFDLMIKRRPPPADGSDPPAKEELRQWDVLSGVMEDPKLRQLLALDGMSLPDSYAVIDQLFVKDGAPAKGGGGGGKGAVASVPDPPPIDRKRFETFFVVRHLGLSDALQAQLGGKAPAGGAVAPPNLAKVRWQDILALGEQIVGLQQRFDEQGIAHEDFLPDSALAEHIGGHSAGLPAHVQPDGGGAFNHMFMGASTNMSVPSAPPGMVFHPAHGWIPAPQASFLAHAPHTHRLHHAATPGMGSAVDVGHSVL